MTADVVGLREQHVAKLEAELPRIVAELKRLGAKRVVLFGSFARGRRDLFTDLDILVVIEGHEPFVQRLARVYGAVAPRVATDLFVYTPEEFEELKDRPFWKHALEASQVLYADG